MLSKVYDFVLSQVSPAYHKRRMEAALKYRHAALQPAPHEGHLAGPKTRAVEDYYETDVFNSVVNSLDPEWITNHKVTGVSFHKDPNTLSKHEYVVLRCSFPGDPAPFYIRLERTHEPNISAPPFDEENSPTEPSTDAPKKTTMDRSPTSTFASTGALKKGHYLALDQFQYVLEDAFRYDQVQCFVPRDEVTILDVAVLACVLHTDSPRYELLRRQCFWFAYMIYEIIFKVFGANDSSVEGLVPVSDKEHKVEKAMGRGKWIVPINKPSELLENLEALTTKFEVEIVKARDTVNQRIKSCVEERERHERNERVAQEETVKRQEAERIAREERSKREGADKEVQRLNEELEALKASQFRVQVQA
ncbi:hypothetical protein BKA70DRAFT_1426373 [Coprinopsis sp. MPI-PUGE-AT-0042]|nr:hypothetical protein BKA70DRAFT_1426373 [Coprinopsis sp. MPI-PUGE-AT-0042]